MAYEQTTKIDDEKKIKIVRSKKYHDWLAEFTSNQPNETWDDEAIINSPYTSNYEKKYARLFHTFMCELKKMAYEQFSLSLSSFRHESFKCHFKLNGNFYEATELSGGAGILRKITTPVENYIYVDEKIPPEIKKNRELIEFIIINKDIDVTPAQYSVHIAHVSTKAALAQQKEEKFRIWYQDGINQKKILLKASKEFLEKLEEKFYSSRDTGHNNIEENTLIAVSLGVLSREEAKTYTEQCELWK